MRENTEIRLWLILNYALEDDAKKFLILQSGSDKPYELEAIFF